MEALKRSRGGFKGAASKIMQKLNTALQADDIESVKVLIEQLKEKETQILTLDRTIYDSMLAKATEGELIDEMTDADEWMQTLIAMRIKASQKITCGPTSSNQASGSATQDTIKLPRLEIKKFHGGVLDWVRFWDQFKASIHDNPKVTDVQKFTYLQSLLEGVAESAILGLPLSAANYLVAIDRLKARFGQKEMIVHAHMTHLLEMTPLTSSEEVGEVRRLFDQCQMQVQALDALGVSADTYGCLLSPVILKLLPEDILLEWNRRSVAKVFKLEDLLSFLQQEVEGRERSAVIKACRPQGKQTLLPKTVVEEERRRVKASPTAKALYVQTSDAEKKEGRGQRMPDTICAFCNSSQHKSWECKKPMDPTQRSDIVRKAGRCFQCLRLWHVASRCYRKKCDLCQRKHHQLLCRSVENTEEKRRETVTIPGVTAVSQTVALSDITASSSIMMKVAHGWAEGPKVCMKVRCLFDDGSHRSFIREDVAKLLNLPMVRSERLMVKGFSDLGQIWRSFAVVAVKLKSPSNELEEVVVELLVIPEIAVVPVCVQSEVVVRQMEAVGLRTAWFPEWTSQRDSIDVLIGLDYYWKLMTGSNYLLNNELMASETIFGWTVSGVLHIPEHGQCSNLVCATFVSVENNSFDNLVKRCWELEAIGINGDDCFPKKFSDNEQQVLRHFENDIRFEQGRYQVRLPWKSDLSRLDTNKSVALRRLFVLLRRFRKEPDLFPKYKQAIMKYVEDEHAEVVDLQKGNDHVTYYIPHHAVVKDDRLTTKVRIVFDASAHEQGSASLNDCLETGPNLNPDLIGLLLRFRKYVVAVLADIERAFLQIGLAKEDQNATRFLWPQEEWTKVLLHKYPRTTGLTQTFGIYWTSQILIRPSCLHHGFQQQQ